MVKYKNAGDILMMKDSKQKSIVNIKEKGRETQVARICRGDLKRGVLSKDAVYDILALRDEVFAKIRELNK